MALNILHDIVTNMNEGAPKISDKNASESFAESPYSKALERYRDLKNSVEEADEYIFRERPAVGKEENTIARLELEIDGCLSEAEACAQRGDYNGEKTMRMIADFKEAEKELLGIYFDARNISPEFGRILEEDLGFIGEEYVGENVQETEVEFE